MSNAKDWSGNKKSIFKIIAASNHSDTERESNDFYATEPRAIDALLEYKGIQLPHVIWEPSCGTGELSKRLIEKGYDVISTDLVDRGYGMGGGKFLRADSYSRRLHLHTHQPSIQVRHRIRQARPIHPARRRPTLHVPQNDFRRRPAALPRDIQRHTPYPHSPMRPTYPLRQERRLRGLRLVSSQLRMVDMAEG